MERFLRSYMYGGGYGGGARTRAVRLGTLAATGVVLPSASVLMPMLQFGEERQAAALLLTLLKVGPVSHLCNMAHTMHGTARTVRHQGAVAECDPQ